MHYYRTTITDEGQQLRQSLVTLQREGIAAENAAAELAKQIGAYTYVPSESDYGGIQAFVFSPQEAHKYIFPKSKPFLPVLGDDQKPILAANGTPYFVLNVKMDEHAMRYEKAQRMRRRDDVIISQGKLRLASVINMMSRTEIIKEGLGHKPKTPNEFSILKFRYYHAKEEAAKRGREAEAEWNKMYAALKTKADFRNMFPHITAGEAQQLEKSRAELAAAVNALEDTDWSIVLEIVPGSGLNEIDQRNVIELARRLYFLPVIKFGDTHRLLGAALSPTSQPERPATFEYDDRVYINVREEAKAEGLEEISAEEYQKALEGVKAE